MIRASLVSRTAVGLAGMTVALLLAARPRAAIPARAVRELAPATLAVGARGSPHTLVIWSDYECSACALLEHASGAALRQLAQGEQLRIEVRHFPLAAHRRARRAAAATICAARQGRGWEMHEALFATAAAWSSGPPAATWFTHLADSMQLNAPALAECVQDAEIAGLLAADVAMGRALGLIAVPAVFLDGRLVRFRTPAALLRRVRRDIGAG